MADLHAVQGFITLGDNTVHLGTPAMNPLATLRLAALAFACCLAAVPSQAQGPLLTLESPNPVPGGGFGYRVSGVPDANGDGFGDLLVGTFRENRAYLFSGADGVLLYDLAAPGGPGFGANFGRAVAGIADVNQDGRGDLLVGAAWENRAYLFSGADGALLYELISPNEEVDGGFGDSVAAMPDANGDGVEDLLVGAEREGDSIFAEGKVYVFSGADGSLLVEVPSPLGESNAYFGRVVEGIPDTNGDGRGDILVLLLGQPYLFSGADGAQLLGPLDATVRSGVGVPDVNGDGRGDILAIERIDFQTDRLVLLSGVDGALFLEIEDPFALEGSDFAPFSGLPRPLAGIPDVDGDGIVDLLASARGPWDLSSSLAYLFSGADGSLLREMRSTAEEFGLFGAAVASVSDVDGDGQADLLIGAPNEDAPRNEAGRVYLFRGGTFPTPLLARTPGSLDFGEVLAGDESEPQTVTVESVGNTAVTVTGLRFEGDDSAFRIVSDLTLPLDIEPGTSGSFEVVFNPAVTGLAETTLFINAGTASRSVALEGSGVGSFGVLTVTKVADTDDGVCDADCSLREAIAAANAPGSAESDTIRFDPSLAEQTIAFAPGHGALTITEDLVIDGDGLGITVDAQRQDRVFHIPEEVNRPEVELTELTITNGYTTGNGGGILVESGEVVLTRSTVIGNEAEGSGGGVRASGWLTSRKSTISNNVAGINGSGISGGVRISQSTISGNRGGRAVSASGEGFVGGSTITRNEGGGISVTGFDGFSVDGNLIAGNTIGGDPTHPFADCGSLQLGFGFVGAILSGEGTGCPDFKGGMRVDPSEVFTRTLDPLLADNGGPTPTHLLLVPDNDPALNPAVDFFPPRDIESTDQRGFPAPFDGDGDGADESDNGSIELVATDLAPAVTIAIAPAKPPVVIPAPGGSFPFTVTLVNTTDQTRSVEAWTLAVLPDRSLRLEAPLLGPVTVTLGPGETLARQLVQRVPEVAPAGDYAYLGYVGDFASRAVLDRDSFGGEKAAARREVAAGAASDGGGWTVLDAATGQPVEAGEEWRSDEAPVAASSAVPTEFALSAAYPNPFRSQTEIALAVPEASEVRVAVYDVLGRQVAVLADGELEAGTHRVVFGGSGLPSGVYLVRAEAEGFVATERVTLVR